MKIPSKLEIKKIIQASNHHAALGSDGITNYFYHKLFHIIKDTLVKVLQNILNMKNPLYPKEHVIWFLHINLGNQTPNN